MTLSPTFPVQAFYVFCVSYAIVSDIRYMKIPNWVSGILAIGFLLYCALLWPNIEILAHLEVTLVVFLLSFLFYYFNWLGGGDVKFITALSLWVGPVHIFAFVMLMSVVGSLLALLILSLRWFLDVYSGVGDLVPGMMRRWAKERVCPYGFAIGIAGLAMAPRIFV